MTVDEARSLVSAKLLEQAREAGTPLVIVDSRTSEASFGWIFYYTSKLFLETHDNKYRLAGNGPVFVNKTTGEVRFYGAVPSLDEKIDSYEKELADKGIAG